MARRDFRPCAAFLLNGKLTHVSSIDLESTSTESTAGAFAALGDPIRLRVIDLLRDGQRCVCEIQEQIGIASNLLSYHLRVLKEAGLVEAARRGRWVDYQLNEDALGALQAVLQVEE